MLFGTGEKSFEKYESGEIAPSGPTKKLLKLAMEKPDLFQKPERGAAPIPGSSDVELIRKTLRAAHVDHIYERMFELKRGKQQANPAHRLKRA